MIKRPRVTEVPMPDGAGAGVGEASRGHRWFEPALLTVTSTLLVVGVAAWAAGLRGVANVCWVVGTGVAVPPAAASIVAALRHRQAGVDLVALLSLVGT